MQIETVSGAAIAALLWLGGSIVTLFTENPDLTLGTMKQSTLIVMFVSALVAFGKDYQALSIRRMVGKATSGSTSQSHWLAAPFLALVLLLGGCGSIGGSTTNTLAASTMAATELARMVRLECGNTEPNGPCTSTSLITTAEKNEIKVQLQQAADYIRLGDSLMDEGRTIAGQSKLDQAAAILNVVEQLLLARGAMQ